MKKILTIGMVTIMAVALASGNAFAKKFKYEGGAPGKGSITGSVSYKGAPKDVEINLADGKNAEFCNTHPNAKDMKRVNHKILANGGKLQDAVIFIDNIAKGKDWKQETTAFDFKTCDIFPKVTVIRKTTKAMKKAKAVSATITNQDTEILHNPHGYSVAGANRKTLFNKPLPSKGSVADVTKNLKRFKKKKDKHFFLQCDQHNFMEADARIVWSPYYSLTGADGSFKIDGIPAGKYKVVAWHPYAGEVSAEVTVGDGEAKQNFEIK